MADSDGGDALSRSVIALPHVFCCLIGQQSLLFSLSTRLISFTHHHCYQNKKEKKVSISTVRARPLYWRKMFTFLSACERERNERKREDWLSSARWTFGSKIRRSGKSEREREREQERERAGRKGRCSCCACVCLKINRNSISTLDLPEASIPPLMAAKWCATYLLALLSSSSRQASRQCATTSPLA